jgi:hypothetical protein
LKRPFDLEIVSGDRNNGFSKYAFHLAQKGYSAEDSIKIIKLMNAHVLEYPLTDNEIEVLLRPET